MRNLLNIIILVLLFCGQSYSQTKPDADKLLREAQQDFNSQNYTSALEKALKGIEVAPDYTDLYLLAGRIYQAQLQNDKARFYYRNVIAMNQSYEDAYTYLINMSLDEKDYASADRIIDKAIQEHPENKTFRLKKLLIYQHYRDEIAEWDYIKSIEPIFPEDQDIKNRIEHLSLRFDSDRIGVNYSYTMFNRDDYGPWHLGSLQYIQERKWGSVIARVNYADRYTDGQSVANGFQYEAESYFYTGHKSYSYVNVAFSDELVFPEWRLGFSYFQNLEKGWEGDLGVRYVRAADRNFTTAVIGIGKYWGSYWINFRTFLQNEKKDWYPAFALTTRYYFETRYDYATVIAGYGTSPDERTVLGQFEQRVGLNSYRVAAGYFRFFGKHWLTGIMAGCNRQEYVPGKMQHEIELSATLMYKF